MRSLTEDLRCSEDSVAFQCNVAAMELFPNSNSIIRGVSGITAIQRNIEVVCTQETAIVQRDELTKHPQTPKQTIKQ